jgi:hypothetical protein
MSNPWDVFPREAHGDDDADQIYLAVGWALSKWESFESVLANLFRYVVNADFDSAAAAYGSIISSQSRLEAILAAARAAPAVSPSMLSELATLLDHIGKLAGRRNEIAHGVVTHFTGPETADHGYYLVPAPYNTRKKRPLGKRVGPAMDWGNYAYTAKQIRQYADYFSLFSDKVLPLISQIHEAQKRLERELKQLEQQ